MFCYQCEQTSNGGCSTMGNCGKDPITAALQDVLVYVCEGISQYAHRARPLGWRDEAVDHFVVEALFTTVTNVNFDPERLVGLVQEGLALRDRSREAYEAACKERGDIPEELSGPATVELGPGLDAMIGLGLRVTSAQRARIMGEDVTGTQDLLIFGLKGTAAYAQHARILGRESESFYAFMHETLDALTSTAPDLEDLLGRCLRCGEINLEIMELLDGAHTSTYGHPEPTPVRMTPKAGKCILVSGHDLKDLEELLKQTEGMDVNVYTHGEMLPAHGYPGLRKYAHLAGNYGGAWQDQRVEFEAFPGPILMTTNCIQEPKASYEARIFTTGLVAWPGVAHLEGHDFASVIEAARQAPGFTEDAEEQTVLVGFGHNAVLGVADAVISAVQKGDLRHFFLVGGCDGARKGRNYYTDFAEAVPEDCVILTLACGKYRFNKLDFGEIPVRDEHGEQVGGIPRLLDCGQCNDAFSAIRIASALAEAFECGVNDLPLSLILSWYEQKAVCILLTLLHLGIRNIRLGPKLPAFVTPTVLNLLVDQFGLKPITTVEQDLEETLGLVTA